MSIRDKLSFSNCCDRTFIDGDSMAEGIVTGIDVKNRIVGTLVVCGTCSEGSVSAIEVNRIHMIGLTSS